MKSAQARIIQSPNQNSGGNEFMNAAGQEVGKAVGREIGKALLDNLF
jgi:hypothetical protein